MSDFDVMETPGGSALPPAGLPDAATARRRQAAVRESLDEVECEACIISNPVHVTYLTGFTGDSSWLILAPSRTWLLTDGRFTEQAAGECPGLDVELRQRARSWSIRSPGGDRST